MALKIESFVASEIEFKSIGHIGEYLKQIGQDRKIDGKTLNFTMMAWIMEGSRRAMTL